MIYPTDWVPTHVHTVFTTESRQKARELFLQTHRAFQRIRVDFCKEDSTFGDFITEEQLRSLIEGGRIDAHNRLFFIVGEAGSGKSELCQWLEYTVDTRARLPIHIPRSMTSAAHVVALLRAKLGDTSAISGLRHAPIETQVEYVALAATVLLYEHGSDALTPTDVWARLLVSSDIKHIIGAHLQAALAGNRAHELLDHDSEIADLCAAHDLIVITDDLPEIARALRRLLARALEQTLWMGDVRELLNQISELAIAQGRRPLLLLEDVTAFQLLGDRLLDYLIDLTSGHFDAVIGVTTGFERTQLAGATLAGDLTHIHHRLRARLVLTDEQGRSYGLEDDLIEFARSYLRAVRPSEKSASDTYAEIFGSGLYPFTETALLRAFRSLHEEGNPRQTPRLLLEHVLAAALLAPEIPPLTLDRSVYLIPPPALFRGDEVADTALQSLLRWYGQIGDEAVTLDARVPTLWGIEVPPQLLAGGFVRVSRAYVAQPPKVDAVQPTWHDELRELQHWLARGGLYPSRETLKRGVERALLGLGDPRALGSLASLSLARAEVYYARGDERLPILLGRGSGDQPGAESYVKVHIEGHLEERGILEELAYLELSGAELSQVSQNLALTLDWAQRRWDDYHAEIRQLLANRMGGVTLEQLIWLVWRLICSLYGEPWDNRPHVRAWGTNTPDYALVSPWDPALYGACHAAGAMLVAWHEMARRLFIGSFMLRDTLIDRDRCLEVTRNLNIDVVLSRLSRLSLRSLRALPYKIRPTGQSLADLITPLQRYALALQQIDVAAALRIDLGDLQRRAARLRAQEDIDAAELGEQLTALRWHCGAIGVTWREAWDTAIETLRSQSVADLRSLREEIEQFYMMGSKLATEGCDLWRYQELRNQLRPTLQHPYWAAAAILHTIQSDLLQAARVRYRRDGRVMTNTREYHELLVTSRAIWQELTNE